MPTFSSKIRNFFRHTFCKSITFDIRFLPTIGNCDSNASKNLCKNRENKRLMEFLPKIFKSLRVLFFFWDCKWGSYWKFSVFTHESLKLIWALLEHLKTWKNHFASSRIRTLGPFHTNFTKQKCNFQMQISHRRHNTAGLLKKALGCRKWVLYDRVGP